MFFSLAELFAKLRVNVREIEHERAFLVDNVGYIIYIRVVSVVNKLEVSAKTFFNYNLFPRYTQPTFTLETRDHKHVQQVLEAIRALGFPQTSLVFNLIKILCV